MYFIVYIVCVKVNCYMIWIEYIMGFDFWCCMIDCKSYCFGNCSNEKCVFVVIRLFYLMCILLLVIYICILLNWII